MDHMMLDIETLDTANTAVVTQVGWCLFNEAKISKPAEVTMDIQEQIDLGRTISANTLKWWMAQPDIARQRVFYNSDPKDLEYLATRLRGVIDTVGVKYVWSHGPHFDIAILKDLLGDKVINYRSARDTRTIALLAPYATKPEPITKHSAGDDAYAQAQWMQNCWQEIGFPHGYQS